MRRHLASEPVAAGPPDLGYRLGKLIRRHRASAMGAGIADRRARRRRDRELGDVGPRRTCPRRTRGQLTARSLLAGGRSTRRLGLVGSASVVRQSARDRPRRSRERDHRLRIGQVLDRLPRLFVSGRTACASRRSTSRRDTSSPRREPMAMVRLWSLETGQEVAPPLEHTDAVNRVRFSPDGARVASASRDGTAQCGRPTTVRRLARRCGTIARSLMSRSLPTRRPR